MGSIVFFSAERGHDVHASITAHVTPSGIGKKKKDAGKITRSLIVTNG
jgi:hypothetical protein